MRGGRQQDHVHTAREDPLVGIESDETILLRHGDLARDRLLSLESPQALLQAIGERVSHRDQLHVGIRPQRLVRRSGSAPSTPDQPHPQRLGPGRRHLRFLRTDRPGHGSHARAPKELPPRQGCRARESTCLLHGSPWVHSLDCILQEPGPARRAGEERRSDDRAHESPAEEKTEKVRSFGAVPSLLEAP